MRRQRQELEIARNMEADCTLGAGRRKRWYHVLVEVDGRRSLIAIEATSMEDARSAVAADWGDENIRDVTLPGS